MNKPKNSRILKLYLQGPGVPITLRLFLTKLHLLFLDETENTRLDSLNILNAFLEMPSDEFEAMLCLPDREFKEKWSEIKNDLRLSVILSKENANLFDVL